MDVPEGFKRGIDKKRLDQYKNFLDPTLADDQEDFYGPIRPIIGPELSVANIQREDILSYTTTGWCIVELFANGQDDLGLETMTIDERELKLTMSIDALVAENIFSNKLEYSQTQTLHEYQHPMEKKRGLFGLGKKGD